MNIHNLRFFINHNVVSHSSRIKIYHAYFILFYILNYLLSFSKLEIFASVAQRMDPFTYLLIPFVLLACVYSFTPMFTVLLRGLEVKGGE